MARTLRTLGAALLCASAVNSVGCMSTGHETGCDSGSCGGRPGHGGALLGGRDGSGISLQDKYNSCVDPCWPERYSYQARQEVLSPFANHVANGQALDQTLFNGDFEAGTATIHPGGLRKLDTIARRRPVDGKLFIQTSRDVPFDAAKVEDYAKTRTDLDSKRVAAVQAYLNASNPGRNLSFDIAVSDPADQQLPAQGPINATRGYAGRFASGIGSLQSGVAQSSVGGLATTANVTGGVGNLLVAPNAAAPGAGAGSPGGTGANGNR